METLEIILDGDGCWPDLPEKADAGLLINGMEGPEKATLSVALLQHGMVSGRPTVTIRFDLPDGRVVVGQTSLRLFMQAARLFATKYPRAY